SYSSCSRACNVPPLPSSRRATRCQRECCNFSATKQARCGERSFRLGHGLRRFAEVGPGAGVETSTQCSERPIAKARQHVVEGGDDEQREQRRSDDAAYHGTSERRAEV